MRLFYSPKNIKKHDFKRRKIDDAISSKHTNKAKKDLNKLEKKC